MILLVFLMTILVIYNIYYQNLMIYEYNVDVINEIEIEIKIIEILKKNMQYREISQI
jgi:hypothetical protein